MPKNKRVIDFFIQRMRGDVIMKHVSVIERTMACLTPVREQEMMGKGATTQLVYIVTNSVYIVCGIL